MLKHVPEPLLLLSKRKSRCVVAGLVVASVILTAPAAHAQVTLKINNKSGKNVCVMWTGVAVDKASVPILTGTTSSGAGIKPSDAGGPAAGYPLTTFAMADANVYRIPNFTMAGGRMWFTYGDTCWAISAGYTPSVADFNDKNFTLRYDKIEAYITGSVDDNLDITAVDAFSIPFSVKAYASAAEATTTQTLRGSLGNSVIAALSAVAANRNAEAPTTPAGASSPLPRISGNSPYLVINTSSQGKQAAPPYTDSPIGSNGAFVRIIANDNQITPFAGDLVAAANAYVVPANYSWTNYDNYVRRMDGRANAPYAGTTSIVGSFVGVGIVSASGQTTYSSALTSPQTYNLVAAFDAKEKRSVTYVKPTDTRPYPPGTGPFTVTFTGFVTLKGTSTIASGAYAGTYNIDIKIPYGSLPEYMSVQTGFVNFPAFMLDPTGVVGANANYLYKYYLSTDRDPGVYSQTDPSGGGPQNNLLTWVEGDLLAGMNVGTVGSDKTLPHAITINSKTYSPGTKIGMFDSQDWWKLGSGLRQIAALSASGSGREHSVYDYYFGFLQTSAEYYNQYAATIYPLTDAYGFAYSDRIDGGRAAISWNAKNPNPIDTVEITILADSTGLTSNPAIVQVIEYYNAQLDHYFITWVHDEIAKLDAGTAIKGWARTGRSFKTHASTQADTSPVCRFYLPPELGNSHFFGRSAAECNDTAASHPSFVLEDPAFMHMVLPVQGICAANTSPIYRVFSNRADANHRYVADKATRNQMVARGWLAEGDGPDRVVMCAPI